MKLESHVLAFIAAFVAAPLAPAQSAPEAPSTAPAAPHQGPQSENLGSLAHALGLSDQQVAQFKALSQQERVAVQAVRADTSLAPEARHAKVEAIRKSFRAQKEALLTPEQLAKFKEIRQQRRHD